MGDGFYAVFDCVENKAQVIQNAVQAGLSILEKLEILNATYFSPYFGHAIQVGIGLHMGKVISGEVQIGSVNHRFVMGLPVNIASRLQSKTKELNNSFIVSADVYSFFPITSQKHLSASVKLRGVNNDVRVFLIGRSYK